jgi:hypothetical protein
VPDGDEARLWLYGVARRVLANSRRGVRRRHQLGERLRRDVRRMVDDAGDLAGSVTASLDLRRALEALPPDDRDVLQHTAWEGLGPQGAVQRQLADGSTAVSGWVNDDGGLCYQLIWDVPAAVGVAPAGTASIDGGEVTFGEEVDGGRLFVWEFATGEMPASLTFRDAAGAELATIDVLVE